jgi:acyl dehydratase
VSPKSLDIFRAGHPVWKFTAPVYVGDTITAEAEVVSVHPTKPVTQLQIRVVRQTGEIVLEGEAWCYTLRPDD